MRESDVKFTGYVVYLCPACEAGKHKECELDGCYCVQPPHCSVVSLERGVRVVAVLLSKGNRLPKPIR